MKQHRDLPHIGVIDTVRDLMCYSYTVNMLLLNVKGLLSTTFIVDVAYRSGADETRETKSLFVKVPLRGPEAVAYDGVSLRRCLGPDSPLSSRTFSSPKIFNFCKI